MFSPTIIFRTILTQEGSWRSKLCKGMVPLFLGVLVVVSGASVARAATGIAPSLGTADSYAVFGASGVTNDVASPTHIWGNVGADLLASITNLDDATQVDGSIIAPTPAQLLTDITTAYNVLAGQQPGQIISLNGAAITVTPGVYRVDATETLNGTVTLDGAGVYIFGSDSAYTVGNDAKVLLTNGATACNVFWQIPSAMTIGTSAEMVGTIITNSEAITLNTSATLAGRAFSRVAAVTLLSNQITEPTCVAAAAEVEEAGSYRRSRYPIISVTKIPSPLALPGPGSVTYRYEVSNPGVYAMDNVTLVDDKCAAVQYISGDSNNDSLLQSTEVWKYRCTMWLSKDTNNKATATGYANGNLPAVDIAYANVFVGTLLPPPLIHVVKTPDRLLLPFGGGRVTYTYEVSNPGIVALNYLQVTDDECSGVRYVSGDSNEDNKLDTDETWTYICQADIELTTTNTVTATGNANNVTATDVAFATVAVAPRPVVVAPVVHSSAPALALAAPTPEVPLLPNTGIGPDGTSNAWEAIVVSLLVALPFLFIAQQTKRLLASKN